MNEHDSPDTGRDTTDAPDAHGPNDVERTIPAQTAHDTDAGSNASFDIDRTLPGKRTRMEQGELAVGDVVLGRYELLEKLGSGAMGVVLKCRDRVSQVEFALKMVPPELARDADAMDDVRENFKLVQGLSHPNIAGVRFLERDEHGAYFLVMEYAEGENLSKWIKRKWSSGRPEPGEVAYIVKQIASALDYAHSQGILHRDVKPANVMISENGRVKVLDFGLASKIRTSMSTLSVDGGSSGGTPGYLAPEQFKGRYPTPAADQYALGVLAYQMLAGHLPFESDDCDVLRSAVVNELPEMIRELPYDVNHCLQKTLSKDPDLRYASCSEFASELERALEESTGVKKAFLSAEPTSGQDGTTGYGGGKRGNILWLVILLLACIGFVVYHFLKQGQHAAQTASSEQGKTGVVANANAAGQNGSSGAEPGVFGRNGSGLSNGNESRPGDINGNGLPDEWEKQFTLTETAPDSDEDGDGFTLKDEYEVQTDPTDPLSHPKYIYYVYVGRTIQPLFPGLELVSVDKTKSDKKDWLATFSIQAQNSPTTKKKRELVRIGEQFSIVNERNNIDFEVVDIEMERDRDPVVYLQRVGKNTRIPCRPKQPVYDSPQAQFVSVLPLWSSWSAICENGSELTLGTEKTGEERYKFDSVNTQTNIALLKTLDEAPINIVIEQIPKPRQWMTEKTSDEDDDRFTLEQEEMAGTDPLDPLSHPKIISFIYVDIAAREKIPNLQLKSVSMIKPDKKDWDIVFNTTQVLSNGNTIKKTPIVKIGNHINDFIVADVELDDKTGEPIVYIRRFEKTSERIPCRKGRPIYYPEQKVQFKSTHPLMSSWRVTCESDSDSNLGFGTKRTGYEKYRVVSIDLKTKEVVVETQDENPKTFTIPSNPDEVSFDAVIAKYAEENKALQKDAVPQEQSIARLGWAPKKQMPMQTPDRFIDLSDNVKLELVKVEAGRFVMGNTHVATLTRDFYIGRTEVTQAQWKVIMGRERGSIKGDDFPVDGVSWNEAMEFCGKLNDMGKAPSGWKFTLPTETQWEYAARGGKRGKGYQYSGSDNVDEVAWYNENSGSVIHPVARKKANELGLYDMSGNVCELCLDDYGSSRQNSVPEFSRDNDKTGSRVQRGGCYCLAPVCCLSVERRSESCNYRHSILGFRVALVPESY